MLGFIVGAIVAIGELIINPNVFMGLTIIEQIFIAFAAVMIFGIFGMIVNFILQLFSKIKIEFRK